MKRLTFLAPLTIAITAALMTSTNGRAFATFGSWSTKPVLYYINPQNVDISPDAAEAAVEGGANAWNTQGGAQFHRSTAAGSPTLRPVSTAGTSSCSGRATNGSALASTCWWTIGSEVIDADVIFWDSAYAFSSGNCYGGVSIEDIATHELGHAIGLLPHRTRARRIPCSLIFPLRKTPSSRAG
jgi:hypothetical protein